MNKFLAGAVFYVVIVWILVIIPLLVAGIALLIMGIKGLKKSKKKTGSIVSTVIGAVFFIASSTAIIVPAVWWIQYYNEAVEADKNYQKRFESQSERPEESEEVNSETVYLIY